MGVARAQIIAVRGFHVVVTRSPSPREREQCRAIVSQRAALTSRTPPALRSPAPDRGSFLPARASHDPGACTAEKFLAARLESLAFFSLPFFSAGPATMSLPLSAAEGGKVKRSTV